MRVERRWPALLRIFLSLCVGAGVAYGVAYALGLADLYLAGHGAGTLGGPALEVPGAGVYLSLADVLVLVSGLLGAGIAWTEMRRHGA